MTVSGARSTHAVDVYVSFRQFGQECRWIVECKLWSKPVTKETVHALRDRVDDLGADRGVIFSESGFQEGARTAAQNTNILLQDSLGDFSETARFHMRRVALVFNEGDEPDAPPVHKFSNRYRPLLTFSSTTIGCSSPIGAYHRPETLQSSTRRPG